MTCQAGEVEELLALAASCGREGKVRGAKRLLVGFSAGFLACQIMLGVRQPLQLRSLLLSAEFALIVEQLELVHEQFLRRGTLRYISAQERAKMGIVHITMHSSSVVEICRPGVDC